MKNRDEELEKRIITGEKIIINKLLLYLANDGDNGCTIDYNYSTNPRLEVETFENREDSILYYIRNMYLDLIECRIKNDRIFNYISEGLINIEDLIVVNAKQKQPNGTIKQYKTIAIRSKFLFRNNEKIMKCNDIKNATSDDLMLIDIFTKTPITNLPLFHWEKDIPYYHSCRDTDETSYSLTMLSEYMKVDSRKECTKKDNDIDYYYYKDVKRVINKILYPSKVKVLKLKKCRTQKSIN